MRRASRCEIQKARGRQLLPGAAVDGVKGGRGDDGGDDDRREGFDGKIAEHDFKGEKDTPAMGASKTAEMLRPRLRNR